MSKAFGIVSVICLGLLALVPGRDYFREWRKYQKHYNEYVSALPVKIAAVRPGIRQIWSQDLERVDRCVSCHLGLREDALADAPQPYRRHPRMHHDFEEIGCTICHDGQGLATSFEASVGLVEYWDKPLLPQPFMEAACGRCHLEEEVPEAPVLSRGRQLMRELNCAACHVLPRLERRVVQPLDGIGHKVQPGWLRRWLDNPASQIPNTRMPDFELQDDEVEFLTAFLSSFTRFPGDVELEPLPAPPPGMSDDQLVELGGTRLREARCISCHAFEGKGGRVAVDLAKIASKVSESWLYNFLADPQRLQPGIEMPRYGFTALERLAVVRYMFSEYVDWDVDEAASPPLLTAGTEVFDRGRELYVRYNCGGCHRLAGLPEGGNPGPDLTRIGDKKQYEIEFGHSEIARTLPAYLFAKVSTPRIFGESMRMPVPALGEADRVAVTTALLGLKEKPVPEAYRRAGTPPSAYDPQGDWGRVVDRYACLGCHVIQGRGRLVATDLSREGSQVNEAWLRRYFQLPYTLRPILTERMPNLFMSDEEIDVAVRYITTALRDDSLETRVAVDRTKSAQGARLFRDHGCIGCHQLGGAGGYVGPPLDGVGERLRPAWLVRWLEDPQEQMPGTLEPDHGFTRADAEAVASYLMWPGGGAP